jgi:hypothetical protein
MSLRTLGPAAASPRRPSRRYLSSRSCAYIHRYRSHLGRPVVPARCQSSSDAGGQKDDALSNANQLPPMASWPTSLWKLFAAVVASSVALLATSSQAHAKCALDHTLPDLCSIVIRKKLLAAIVDFLQFPPLCLFILSFPHLSSVKHHCVCHTS